MKLTRYQIDTIVDAIYQSKVDIELKKRVALAKKWTPAARVLARKAHSAIQSIPKCLRDEILRGNDHSISFFTSRIIDQKLYDLPPVMPRLYRNDLRRKIILASIDASTVEELKRKLNIKF